MMRFFPSRSLLALAVFGSTLLSATDGPTLATSLVWKPTSTLLSGSAPLNLMPFAKQKLVVLPLVDKREEKGLLGENTEKDYRRYIATNDDIAAYVTKRLITLLAQPGLPVSAQAEGATVVISGELQRFYVTENSTYKGEFRALLQVESAGKVLWRGLATGENTRFGRSYKLENYHETLSDTLIDAVSHLLADRDFMAALANTPAPASTPAK
jgi:hypothetical protein